MFSSFFPLEPLPSFLPGCPVFPLCFAKLQTVQTFLPGTFFCCFLLDVVGWLDEKKNHTRHHTYAIDVCCFSSIFLVDY